MPPETTDEAHPDLRARVFNLEHASQAKEVRLSGLEQWRIATDLALARRDEQFTVLREDIKTIKSTMSRIMWLIVSAIVAAIMAFMIRGGFHVP